MNCFRYNFTAFLLKDNSYLIRSYYRLFPSAISYNYMTHGNAS